MKISPSCSNLTLGKRICIDHNQNTGTAEHCNHPETLMFYWQTIRENIITKNILINRSEIVISFFFDLLVTLSLPSSFRWYDFVFSDQTYSSDVISKLHLIRLENPGSFKKFLQNQIHRPACTKKMAGRKAGCCSVVHLAVWLLAFQIKLYKRLNVKIEGK